MKVYLVDLILSDLLKAMLSLGAFPLIKVGSQCPACHSTSFPSIIINIIRAC